MPPTLGPSSGPKPALPLRTRAAVAVIELLSRPRVEDIPTAALPAAREKRRKTLASPAARVIAGTPHPDAPGVDMVIDAPGGPALGGRVYRRRGSSGRRPLVVYYHGGGWVFGDPQQSEWLCSHLAALNDVVVVSVDYRMAPEFPFPTPVEDAYRATDFIVANAAYVGADTQSVTVMGDSAGGNLAAVVALLARDRGGPRITGQVLIYPAVELFDTLPSEIVHSEAPILTAAAMHRFKEVYLAGADPRDPLASPARAKDHSGLPPALIITAEADPLRDNGLLYADILSDAGVPVRYSEYRGSIHGFLSLPGISPGARQALWEIGHFLKEGV